MRLFFSSFLLLEIVFFFLQSSSLLCAEKPAVPRKAIRFSIRSFPISSFSQNDPSQTRFGQLEFAGGLELQSDQAEFGGLSSLRIEKGGKKLFAVSDAGFWFTADLQREEETGRITEIENAVLLAARGHEGLPLAEKKLGDLESLAMSGPVAWIGIEKKNEIMQYSTFSKDGIYGKGKAVTFPLPNSLRKLKSNTGLESLCVVPRQSPHGGKLLAIGEDSYEESPDKIPAALLGGARSIPFSIKKSNAFSITDCAFLPNGDLLLLERYFSVLSGNKLRIRKIPFSSVHAGVLLDGDPILEADSSYQIDNMEGISVFETSTGRVKISLISDNNYSVFQRTLLLEFFYDSPEP